jgi:hypothetical protein
MLRIYRCVNPQATPTASSMELREERSSRMVSNIVREQKRGFGFLMRWILLFGILQLQGCKAAMSLIGGGILSYVVEKSLDKLFGSLAAAKPADEHYKIDKATGRTFLREWKFVDSRTKKVFVFHNLTGDLKNGYVVLDQESLLLVKERLGAELCPNGACKVTKVFHRK